MRSSQLKRQVFIAQKCKSEVDVRNILEAVEQHGRVVQDRAALMPQVGQGDYRIPLKILPNDGAGLVLEELNSVEGILSAYSVQRMNSDFLTRVVELPGIWRVFMKLGMSLKGMRHLRLQLSWINATWFLGFSWDGYTKDDAQAQACLARLVELARLPVEIRTTTSGFSVRHLEAGGLVYTNPNDHAPEVGIENYGGGVNASVPGAATHDMLARFQAIARDKGVKARDGEWWFIFRELAAQEADPIEVCRQLSQLKGIGKKVSCSYFWHLQTYKDFPRMAGMTRYFYDAVAQSLLEFEFGGARRGQLDLMCKARDTYRLFISFDDQEAADEFVRIFKIKLKPLED